MDSITEPLNKSEIPHNILFGRMMPLSSFNEFIGSDINDTTNNLHFLQAIHEIYYSSFTPDVFIEPDSLYHRIDSLYDAYNHPLGYISVNYGILDTNAILDSLIFEINGKLYDDTSRTESPYFEQSTFISAPVYTNFELDSGIHYFYLDSCFVITNKEEEITEFFVDFQDGNGLQYRNVVNYTKDEWVEIEPFEADFCNIQHNLCDETYCYGTVNAKIGYKISTVDSFFSNAKIKIHYKLQSTDFTIGPCMGEDSFEIVGYPCDECDVYGEENETASGTAYILFADENCASKTITRPVIFLDGFDPTNNRRMENIYSEYINSPLSQPLTPLGTRLLADGYDFIIFDYHDGGDLIEKNAKAVAKLIETLYENYGGENWIEDIVLVGPSYGALVAEYALSWMESESKDYHTRLYIAFDGPHQGANVPIGIQHFVNYLDNGQISHKLIRKELGSILPFDVDAARQMLVDHHSSGQTQPTPNVYRAYYLDNLDEINKYPTLPRKIAIINGGRKTLNNSFLYPGTEFFHIQTHTPLGALIWKIFCTPVNNTQLNSSFITDLQPYNAIFGLYSVPYNHYSQPLSPNNQSYDDAPGSYFKDYLLEDENKLSYNQIGKLILRLLPTTISINTICDVYEIDRFTFMPLISTIDLNQNSIDLHQNIENTILSNCEGNTPFDYVYAPEENQNHCIITDENAEWFENEIKGQPNNLGTFYTNISGTSLLCLNNNMIYSVTNLPSNSSIQWSVTTNLEIVSGQNTNYLTIRANNYSAYEVLTANISNYCGLGNLILKKVIQTGVPNPSLTFEQIGSTCYFEAICTPELNSLTYLWSENNFTTWTSSSNNNYGNYEPEPNVNESLWVKVQNSCGTSSSEYAIFDIEEGPCNCYWKLIKDSSTLDNQMNISIFPNPSKNYWFIVVSDEIKGNCSFELTNIRGQIVWRENADTVSQGMIALPNVNFDNGLYFLKAIINNQVNIFKLIKF